MVRALVAIVLSSSAPGWSQSQASDLAAAAAFARDTAVKALTYTQGDRQTLTDAESDFTPGGWREFMRRMTGFVDAQGAPLGGSTFVPDGDAVVKRDDSDVMQYDVPGTLRQTQGRSSTTYQVTVRIELNKAPLRIERMTPTICGSVVGSQPRRTACP